ncbi:MAG: purine-nucleoside phosphorylase [Ignavibacteria bacterium]|nr:purine-nucleoside phosphorylase [Ignavibacteria bacterium]
MTDLRKKINDAVSFIRSKTAMAPSIGIILGTGLGGLANEIEKETVIEYEDIPHFPVSTVESHHGKLIFGRLGGKDVVAMQGRFHYYEGYTMQQITFPVRVMSKKVGLGVDTLFISNAGGGMNPDFHKGDLMIMSDHINLLGDNPLVGPNDDELGVRFPDMSEPYSKELIALAEKIAVEEKIKIQKGVYVAVTGPNLETAAEYKFLRMTGADAVGMSTIPENIVANHMNMRCFGITIITDLCFPESLEPVNVEKIIAVAKKAEPKMTLLMKKLIERI